MKIFLDTADSKAIQHWTQTGIIDGVTTNPTHLSREGGDPVKKVLEICALLPKGEISVEVTEKDPQRVYEQAKAIAALAKNVMVKIPCHVDYYHVIHKLVQEGVPLNITLVFTVIQSLMMCKLGVRYVSPFIGRWDDIDVEGFKILHRIREMIDQYGYKTQILAASLRHVRHLHHAIMSGADVATVPVDVLAKAVEHPLTDRGIEKFDADWQKLGIRKFP